MGMAAGQLPFGLVSDRIGRLPVLIVSQIGTAFSFVMLAFAPSASILFAARILDGITGGNIMQGAMNLWQLFSLR